MRRNIRLTLAVPAFLFVTTLAAQTNLQLAPSPTPAPRTKFGGAGLAQPARATQAGAAVKSELGMDAVISPELQIKRLQKKVAELSQQARSLQIQIDSLNASLEAVHRSTITYRCEAVPGGGSRSVNSLGVAMECSPYSCDATSGRCFRPPCATSNECGPGTACDVGGTNLCVNP